MTSSPGQTCPQRRHGLTQRERGHRHQVICAADDMNGAGGKTSQDADQQSTALKNHSAGQVVLTLNQLSQSRLHVLLTHQRLSDQYRLGSSSLNAIQVRPFEQT